MNELELFMNLFRGRTDVWGSVEGKSNKEAITTEHYKKHLEGTKSVGVYPLLDDGTCNFYAVDLDEKNFEKAKAIRNELMSSGINMYIAASKGKGYHIYGFGDSVIAKDIRHVLIGALDKLKISAEVFPKQDMLDETIKFGNYINLPCFGTTRQFQSTDQTSILTGQALMLIQKNGHQAILDAASKVVAPAPLVPQKPKKDSKGKKHKSPPCVEKLLRGSDAGMRDEAAFALARHFLDQGDTPEEVLARLLEWDARNKPPIGDMRILQTKVKSAEHGYAFGCNSITGGLLSGTCIGKQNCQYFKNEVKEKKKTGDIVERSFYEDDDFLYEEIVKIDRSYQVTDAEFLRYEKKTGIIEPVKEIATNEKIIWPIIAEEIAYKAVIIPTGIEEYGDTVSLVEEIKAHIWKYADLPDNYREFAAWYILMSWVYSRLPSMAYLRFLGDWGTGKSRSLEVIGGLCYKRMKLGGALTSAPLFRMMKKYEGSLILDEADFDKSDTTHEIVKILNSGIEKGTPIMRCTKDDPDNMQVFPCFGPKAFATRMRFKDDALESRCLTVVMEESDRSDIPTYLAMEHAETQRHLINKLLLFRFRNMTRIPEQISEKSDIDLGNIESRLKQVCIPFAMVFADIPETLDRFKRFLQGYAKELRASRMDSVQGRVVYAMFKAAVNNGIENVTMDAIGKIAVEELKLDVKINTISRILHNMKIVTERKRYGTERFIVMRWNPKLMTKLYRKYLNDLNPAPEEESEESQFLTILGFRKELVLEPELESELEE